MTLSVSSPLGTPLSSFEGADDSERLQNYDKERKNPNSPVHGWPVLLDQPRVYTFTRPLLISDGFVVQGTSRPQEQARGSKPVANVVSLRLPSATGGWLQLPNGPTFGVALRGLSFDANATSRVIVPNAQAVLWTSVLRDISYQNGPGVLGSSAIAQPCDGVTISGYCNWNNIRDVAYNWAGSDCGVLCELFLIDSPPAFMGPKGYLVRQTSLSKTKTVGWYMTCEQHSGVLLANNNNYSRWRDCEIEGRNANTPCYGALVRASSAYSQWTSCWFAYAMTNPGLGANPADKGLFHATSGTHELLDCHTKRATGVSEDVPFAFGEGPNTKLIVRNIVGEGYTLRPVVRVVNGAKAETDGSVRVVTV